jgi:serine protease Do
MFPSEPRRHGFAFWILLGSLGLMFWGFQSGHLIWTGKRFGLAAYQVPSGGPTAEVHPEVLNLQASFSRVAELVKPAVVSISTIHIQEVPQGQEFYFGDPFEDFFQQYFGPGGPNEGPSPRSPRRRARPQQFKSEGVGSGVIIDADGLVLTNEHVVRDADQIKVNVYEKDGDKKEYVGRVVGKDARTDIAVVRISAGHKLPYAALGDSERVRVGDWAIAIGSPFNLAQTMTVGIISSNHQSLPIEGKEYKNLIQTDAAINRGNSGGPLINIHGEVVGINTAIYAPTGVFAGVGFAIPINQAKAILQDLVHKGHVTRGWLGVELAKEITPAMVKNFGLPNTQGALVNDVMKTSPAEKSGLQRGDVILSFDGKPVESSDKLQNLVSQTAPKKAVKVEIIRSREKKTLTLVLGERPDSADNGGEERGTTAPDKNAEKPEQREWQGVKVEPFTDELAASFNQPKDLEGVAVVDVKPGSNADAMGLAQGDVIRSVNQTPTPNVSEFRKATEKVNLSQGVVLDVVRQGHPIYLSFTKE